VLTEILHDVFVLQVLEELDFGLQSAKHALLPLLVWPGALGQLHLLDGHQQSTIRVHSKIDFAEGASANQGALDPLVGS
jgi:hypothetical protein